MQPVMNSEICQPLTLWLLRRTFVSEWIINKMSYSLLVPLIFMSSYFGRHYLLGSILETWSTCFLGKIMVHCSFWSLDNDSKSVAKGYVSCSKTFLWRRRFIGIWGPRKKSRTKKKKEKVLHRVAWVSCAFFNVKNFALQILFWFTLITLFTIKDTPSQAKGSMNCKDSAGGSYFQFRVRGVTCTTTLRIQKF